MLVTKSSLLTVRRISAHLGVQPWIVARELKRPGGLAGVKARGAGRVGQGGQWQITVRDYLTWLGVPPADRRATSPDGLPALSTLASVAQHTPEQLTEAELSFLIDIWGVPHLRVGRRRYLTDSQCDALQAALQAWRSTDTYQSVREKLRAYPAITPQAPTSP